MTTPDDGVGEIFQKSIWPREDFKETTPMILKKELPLALKLPREIRARVFPTKVNLPPDFKLDVKIPEEEPNVQ